MKSNHILNSFLGFSIIYLLIIFIGREDAAWYLKPFLLPFLILAVYVHEKFNTQRILLTALILSWIGDIILMFADNEELYFIAGLIAFLLSHISYIILFSKQLKIYLKKSKIIFWIGVTAIAFYLIVMMLILLPSLGDLKIPVFLYALTISIMLLFALKGFLNWQKPASIYILIGAIVFVASDSLLAFDKFYAPLQYSSILIMATYLIAQYLIVDGILKLNTKK
ncbi:lysoplasmalogenase [Flavobacterium glaciei]|uniref:Membrane protein YhhN n=1 Tax=Flavobacterium glaciei TaxID=386300 RepID=A0A562PUJ1_9FLAO|nr:lysoplasmalogenase [Flavobacterium glaciei]RDI56201.1 putative membrane protein YhhN [Flavobacterium glaciei]TWI48111.1 putative membrane protein YhhN [Flavobacterium glaciei]